MKPVISLQGAFQSAVLANDLAPNLFVREGPGEVGGFDLYLNAYRARLTEALKDNYPVLYLAMGDQSFELLATSYIDQRPSTHRSIRWFGSDLRVHVDANPDLLPHPALADLTSMDWALRGAFDAADADVLTIQTLATIAPEKWPQMTFELHPSVALLDLNWRIGPIWHELNENADAQTELPDELAHIVLIWRQGLECKWRSLSASESQALYATARGLCFADVCECLAGYASDQAEDEFAHSPASLLNQWLADGLLVRATVGD
jgi:Putative DNA-binding domain